MVIIIAKIMTIRIAIASTIIMMIQVIINKMI
jgi:hypothetical protein